MSGPLTITGFDLYDIRFPTSLNLDGSDAMNPEPDYSVAYVVLHTGAGLEGHGFTFTIGYGTEICVLAASALAELLVGANVEELVSDLGAASRTLTGSSPLRWLGPEKGVVALASAAVLNAMWDLYAKLRGVPLWKLLVDLTPEEVVAAVDFRYLSDYLTPREALGILRGAGPGKAGRTERLRLDGLAAYTTSPGWLGYDDEKLRRLCQAAVDQGFSHLKLKVGRDLESDRRRCGIARSIIGADRFLMVDANQVWEVPQAIEWVRSLAPHGLAWVEEPTSPDDVVGHAAIAAGISPIPVATGEQVQNRVVFKQLFQLGGIGVCQIDACRVAGVNDVLAVLLMAAKASVPVCPHAGGVGLCELVTHLAAFDQIAVSATSDGRIVEYVENLHEHFAEPCVVSNGRYRLPARAGYAELLPESIERYRFPGGPVWRELVGDGPARPASALAAWRARPSAGRGS